MNEKTILLTSEEYQNGFEEDGLPYKVCKDIEFDEAYRMVSHQKLHSKKWLLGCPPTEFSSSSSSSSSLSSSSYPPGY